MSNESRIAMMTRLRKLYPFEYTLIQEIAKKYQKVRKYVSPNLILKEGEQIDISFSVAKSKSARGTEAGLHANDEGIDRYSKTIS